MQDEDKDEEDLPHIDQEVNNNQNNGDNLSVDHEG